MEELLQQILDTLKKQEDRPLMITVEQASNLSGIGRNKILELCSAQNTDFPCARMGRKILINRELLDVWLKKCTQEHREI